MCKTSMDWPVWGCCVRLAGSVAALGWRDKQLPVGWALCGALAEFWHVVPVPGSHCRVLPGLGCAGKAAAWPPAPSLVCPTDNVQQEIQLEG